MGFFIFENNLWQKQCTRWLRCSIYVYCATCRELIDHTYNTRKLQLVGEQYQILIDQHRSWPWVKQQLTDKDSGSEARRVLKCDWGLKIYRVKSYWLVKSMQTDSKQINYGVGVFTRRWQRSCFWHVEYFLFCEPGRHTSENNSAHISHVARSIMARLGSGVMRGLCANK